METYNGHVRTPADAIILFEACRLGLLPRVQRRLSEKERQSIRSGSVFVWDEREAGMRRWTDGKSWSASRVSGSFLTYREMEGKRGGNGFAPPVTSRGGRTPESDRNSGDNQDMDGEEGPDGYRYKPDGLMKQSFSITTSNAQHLHLISYYARSHPNAPGLNQPSTDPNLRTIRPARGMYPESTIADQNGPAVTRAPMAGAPNYVMPPQNNTYARPGATHPQGYAQPGYAHPAYNFPPSPMSTPPNTYTQHQQHYGPSPGSLPPLGTNGHYQGQQQYSPQQYTPLSQPPPPFDQRPMRTPDAHLPHPPPMPQYSNPSSQGAPTYMQGPPPSLYAQPSAPPRRISPPQPPSTPSQIDPRLFAPGVSTVIDQSSSTRIEDTAPEPRSQENNTAPLSAASQAPTIGAMVNGNNTAEEDTAKQAEKTGEQQGSTDPGDSQQNSAPQDIPNEKLGFHEDKRALSQLDKMFNAPKVA